jgi:hypothetical protein
VMAHDKGTKMEKAKRKRLEKTGWKVGSVAEFLGMSREEAAIVESRLRAMDRSPSYGRSNLDRIRQTLSPSRRRAIAARMHELIAEDGDSTASVRDAR